MAYSPCRALISLITAFWSLQSFVLILHLLIPVSTGHPPHHRTIVSLPSSSPSIWFCIHYPFFPLSHFLAILWQDSCPVSLAKHLPNFQGYIKGFWTYVSLQHRAVSLSLDDHLLYFQSSPQFLPVLITWFSAGLLRLTSIHHLTRLSWSWESELGRIGYVVLTRNCAKQNTYATQCEPKSIVRGFILCTHYITLFHLLL